jgi:hypothetical protein
MYRCISGRSPQAANTEKAKQAPFSAQADTVHFDN